MTKNNDADDRFPKADRNLKQSDAFYQKMYGHLPWSEGCGPGTYTVRSEDVFRTCTRLDSAYRVCGN